MAKGSKKKLGDQVDQALATNWDDTPPGMLPDGKLNIVQRDDPPFEPQIVDELGRPISAEEGTEADRDGED